MAVANEVSFSEHLSGNRRVITKEAGIDIRDDCQTLSIMVEKNASSSGSLTPYLMPYEGWHKYMREWLPSIQGCELRKQVPSAHMIRKVPDMLRRKELCKGCFDPLVVSIGPYHHGKSELGEVERLKTPTACQFVHESGKLFGSIFAQVERISGNARKCYPEDSTYQFDDEEFARMMFLDGCFILQFISSIFGNGIEGMKSNVAAFVRRDLLLLENQLPYQVLQVLMTSRFKGREGDELIDKFIKTIRGDFHQESFIGKIKSFFSRCHSRLRVPSKDKKEKEHQPVHLVDLFRTRFVDKKALTRSDPKTKRRDCYSYPAAKELRTLGILFRPSKGDRFTDIKFTQTFVIGTLCLPKLMIDDTTESLLSNLVAYESCPGGPDDGGVTSYVCFMDSLIDQAEDVKELRSKRIIYNILGSDQQAADLFNRAAKDLVPHPHAFTAVRNDIERHSNSKLRTWMAECLHTHFSSPWTIIAFIAATITVVLTVLQTYVSLKDYCSDESKENHDFLCVFF